MAFTYPEPIPDGAIDLTPVPVNFTGDLNDTLGNMGTDADGFLSIIAGPIQYVADHPTIAAGLDDALGGVAATVPQLETPFHQDFADTLSGFITQGDPDFQQFSTDLTANNPPPPQPKPTGGGGGGTPTQSAKCGTYGSSQILLSDNTLNLDAASTLPVVNIPDGQCQFIYLCDGSQFMGRCDISATALQSGDAQLFSVSHDTVPGAAGQPPTSRFIVTLAPYKTGHFQARFNVTTNRYTNRPEVWWMAVDVINQAPAGGGGTGGTPAGGGTPPTPPTGTPPSRGPVTL